MANLLLSTESNLTQALSIIDSVSLNINPYPIILQGITKATSNLCNSDVIHFGHTIMIVHAVLLSQAIMCLSIKLFFKRNGERKKFWLWRKHYESDQTLPYFVPNGDFVIELLQIFGYACFEWFTITNYRFCKYPRTVSASLEASSFFWLSLSLAPCFIGFWFSGWSAFYLVLFSPTQADLESYPRRSYLRHPLVMNIACIGVPALIMSFFIGIGVAVSTQYETVNRLFSTFLIRLDQLSATWAPNDPTLHQNNEGVLDSLRILVEEGREALAMGRILAFGWATMSIIIMLFYTASTIAVTKLLKRTFLITSGKKPLLSIPKEEGRKRQVSETSPTEAFNPSIITDDYDLHGGMEAITCNNEGVTLKLRRNYYLSWISCGIMVVALGFHFSASMLLGFNMGVFLFKTYWQARFFALITCSVVLLSFSMFVQSVMLLWWN